MEQLSLELVLPDDVSVMQNIVSKPSLLRDALAGYYGELNQSEARRIVNRAQISRFGMLVANGDDLIYY